MPAEYSKIKRISAGTNGERKCPNERDNSQGCKYVCVCGRMWSFKYLMKRLGYVFKIAWMEVRGTGVDIIIVWQRWTDVVCREWA